MVHLHRSGKQFYTTIVAANGEVLYTSETVHRRRSAFKTASAASIALSGQEWSREYVDHTTVANPKKVIAPAIKFKSEL